MYQNNFGGCLLGGTQSYSWPYIQGSSLEKLIREYGSLGMNRSTIYKVNSLHTVLALLPTKGEVF